MQEELMDRRQRKSRDAIFSAFNQLLTQKKYTNITVQDIIDEANVGRTTFYAHFPTKDNLLREMCTDIFDHVSQGIDVDPSHNYSIFDDDPSDIISHILYHLTSNHKQIIGVLSCESSELFWRFFKEYLNEIISGWILSRHSFIDSEVPLDFIVDHVSGSFINMVQWWIKNNLKQTPEELTQYFMVAIGPLLSNSS